MTTVTKKGNTFLVKQIPTKENEKAVSMQFLFFENGVILKMAIDGTDINCTQKFLKV